MTSTLNVYAHYVNGWCGKCGRRRNRDGACPNCDAWWSSPLVQVGLPLITVLSVLMWVGISTIRADFPAATVARTTDPASDAPYARGSASSPRYSPGAPSFNYAPWAYPALPGGRPAGPSAAPFQPHAAAPAAFASAAALPPATASLIDRQLADLERLRVSVAQADRAFRESQESGFRPEPAVAAVPAARAYARPRPDFSVAAPDAARNLQPEADVL